MDKKTLEMLKGYTGLIAMWIFLGIVVVSWFNIFIDFNENLDAALIGAVGSIIGGIIGGIVAYLVAAKQIKAQRLENEKNDIESNRSFFVVEEFYARSDLLNIKTNPNSKLIETEDYKELKKLGAKRILFFKIHHVGLPDIVFKCRIRAFLNNEYGTHPYEVTCNMTSLEKGIELFVPVANPRFKILTLNRIEISYKTIKNENILFVYDSERKNEKHILMNNENQIIKELTSVGIGNCNWVYPAKFDYKR
ncbi:hypothetical protein [Brevibacillus laterosporus]|uniref:hypothetical protein n=1 Tax=Brevibacillus laterosporus TaxID=1465 RepID=UPI002654CD2F|nr:hypothetical protein [Brevibacillus laterosporus]MDN9012821.1 hypothetical protein [Brevibacillus laterosporus]MDO0943912.1 hypothetical protein [Brevibacillus laterosporus]